MKAEVNGITIDYWETGSPTWFHISQATHTVSCDFQTAKVLSAILSRFIENAELLSAQKHDRNKDS